jgi:hypothetical protein
VRGCLPEGGALVSETEIRSSAKNKAGRVSVRLFLLLPSLI